MIAFGSAGCDTEENPLAPYEGSRPLILLRVTQSYAPDIQWVGGNVGAIGINRGDSAALDSTLIWLRTSPADDIVSPISVDENFDLQAILQAGGVPSDSLESEAVYTIWVAERSALDAGLAGAAMTEHAFADTTIESAYMLQGRSGGGVDVEFEIFRNETLLNDSYTVRWTPAVPFRRIAIREASLGGYTDLLWHVVMPDSVSADILPPVVIGQAPEGAIVAEEWAGWSTGTQTLWAATRAWNQTSFSPRAAGYAYFQARADNFEE